MRVASRCRVWLATPFPQGRWATKIRPRTARVRPMSRAAVACFLLIVGATAARGDAVGDCDQLRDCDLRLKACSALIASGEPDAAKLAALYVKRGQAQLCKGGADSQARATADYTKAIEIDPRTAKAYFYRGSVYSNENKHEAAIEEFSQAIDLDPEDADAVRYRGLSFFVLGQNDRAIADLDKAVALKPDAIVNYFRRGEVLFAVGQHEPALADFTKAIELDPTAETYGMRAYHYRQLGQNERAIADDDKRIELLPDCASCYFDRGLSYEKIGDRQRAIADYRKAIALRDSYQAARAALERLGEAP
jgi:tetratricopeptide (TPR) repeat protein